MTSTDSIEPQSGGDVDANLETDDPKASGVSIVQRQSWIGPLPPPKALDEFDKVVPGLAREISDASLEEGKTRRRIVERQSRTAAFQGIAGTIFAFILAFVLAIGGLYLVAKGKALESLVPFAVALVPFLTALLFKRKT